MSKTILTGLQATGNLHIGNYFGAILPMIENSRKLESGDKMFFFVPDLHSLTIDLDYSGFYQAVLDNVKIYLASGIGWQMPNIQLYRQSFISAHSEMCWLLSCFAYFGEISRMTQFKEKSGENEKNVNVGLFSYPILMAGDILLYNADFVPVGEDQQQHVELTRNLAIRINNKFEQKVFQLPKARQEQLEFLKLEQALRLRSLTNPEKKMSKSSPDIKSKILLSGNPAQEAKKIMSATTDSFSNIQWDWQKQPGLTNLLQIYNLLSKETLEETKAKWQGQSQYGPFKAATAKLVKEFLTDFQAKLAQISNEDAQKALQKGEAEATKTANETLFRFQKVLGLRK